MKQQERFLINGDVSTCFYNTDTPKEVVKILESEIHTDNRVRIWLGDTERPDFQEVHGRKPESGNDWGEEYDVIGTIGRSTGMKPIVILLNNSRSSGGGAILTDCIIRIMVKKYGTWREVYRHPNFHSKFTNGFVDNGDLPDHPEYTHIVRDENKEVVARFHSYKSACNWLAFMRGERFSK